MSRQGRVPRLTDAERRRGLLAYLRERLGQPALDYAAPPHALLGGTEATVLAFRLAGAPPPFDGPLVLRQMRRNQSPERAAAEAGIHDAARAAGVPTPACLLHEPRPEILGGAFLVLEKVEGEALLGGLASEVLRSALSPRTLWRTVRDAPALWRQVPVHLAEAALAVSRVDAAVTGSCVSERGGAPAFLGLDARLARIERRIARVPLAASLAPAFDWLVARRPKPPERPCLVHGDLAPTNLLVREGRVVAVLDWAKALLAEPEAEIGFLRVASRTMAVSGFGGLNALIQPLFSRIAEQVTERYESERPLDLERLRWYETLRAVSLLASIAKRTKPWKKRQRPHIMDSRGASRATAQEIERLTGLRLGIG